MVTTKRSADSNTRYERDSIGSGIALLERNVPVSYDDYLGAVPVQEESYDNTREKMRENLDRLLNYNRYSAQVVEEEAVCQTSTEEKVEEVINSAYVLEDEDIRPTSTTMQFGDIDAGEITNEMKNEVGEKENYRLSSKGKLLIVLYSLVVAVVMALIIVNTGVLNGLNTAKAESLNVLAEKQGIYAEVKAEGDRLADPERIIEIVEKDMIK